MRFSEDYRKKLLITDKIKVIMSTAETTVTRDTGYIPLLEDMMYQYSLLNTCGAITDDEEFTLDMWEEFVEENHSRIEEIIGTVDGDETIKNACHKAILFRAEHGVGSLLDGLLTAIINWINTGAGQEIDMDAVQSLQDIMPLLKDVDSVDLAKAVISADKKIVSFGDGDKGEAGL